jgi:Transposase and inactivated derivatives
VAFNNLFEKRAKDPRFKLKYNKQSIQYTQNITIIEQGLKLPKIGEVKAIIYRPIKGKIKTVTISKNFYNQYFASVLFEDGQEKLESSTDSQAIGIDVGLTHFAITSNSSKYDNPKFLKSV